MRWGRETLYLGRAAKEADRQHAGAFLSKLRDDIVRCVSEKFQRACTAEHVHIDFPKPPSFERVAGEAFVEIGVHDYIPLAEIFPIQNVMASYVEQHKYRVYVFATDEELLPYVAMATYLTFNSLSIVLNDLGLRLAHQDVALCQKELMRHGFDLKNWRTSEFLSPGYERAPTSIEPSSGQ
jgi:hypothetical protein